MHCWFCFEIKFLLSFRVDGTLLQNHYRVSRAIGLNGVLRRTLRFRCNVPPFLLSVKNKTKRKRWYTAGGVYVRCIYTHARWELPKATQVFVVVLVWRISRANCRPCVLIQNKTNFRNWTKNRGSTLKQNPWNRLSFQSFRPIERKVFCLVYLKSLHPLR